MAEQQAAPAGNRGQEPSDREVAGSSSVYGGTLVAYRRILDALRAHGSRVIESNDNRASAQCPAHDDRNPSLSVTGTTDSVLVWCHAGCDTRDVLVALGLDPRDLYDEPRGAAYRYPDGRTVHRTPYKQFRQSGNTTSKPAALYRADRLPAAVKDEQVIYVVEGEKDAHAIEAVGGVATCAPMGAGKWTRADPSPLFGGNVWIVADRDDEGHKHARDVYVSLDGHCSSVRVVQARAGKDAADHIAAGHGLDEFVPLDLDTLQTEAEGEETKPYAFVPGGTFILDTAPDPEPLWGVGTEVLLADGEALIIAGDQGIGKTTLGQQLALGRCGIPEYASLLGYPVKPGARRTLYLAMDRPRQAARSFRRMVGEAWRAELDDRLIVWQGPPPWDLAKHPALLLDLCRKADADTVVVDSLKDAAIGLNDDETGAGYNRARQTTIAEGVQVIELHHNRKAQHGAKGTPGLSDVYGSTWLTSGVGSVILLTGSPGDPIVGLRHLKPPADEVGPVQVIHDHTTGRSQVFHAADLRTLAREPVSALDAARALFETSKPTANEKEKARRRLEKAVRDGVLRVAQPGDKTTSTPRLWVAE